jgi:hypothetical protein
MMNGALSVMTLVTNAVILPDDRYGSAESR